MEYIHYGASKYDPKKFKPIKNLRDCCGFSKPYGGLWASPVITQMGWKDWNEKENFRVCDEQNSFRFKLKSGCKIAYIDSEGKLNTVPDLIEPGNPQRRKFIDFEKALEIGFDAIEISISKCPSLYWALYGWDCDSIVVLNKGAIEETLLGGNDER